MSVRRRLRGIIRELDAAVVDAQVRDWTADRPDRVTFARLGQARAETSTAARRYRATPIPVDPWAVAAGAGGFFLVAALAGVTGVPLRPLVTGVVAVAGLWAGAACLAILHLVRRRRARQAYPGAALVDEATFHPVLRERLDACAGSARNDDVYRRRSAAADLEYALDWLAAAQQVPRP